MLIYKSFVFLSYSRKTMKIKCINDLIDLGWSMNGDQGCIRSGPCHWSRIQCNDLWADDASKTHNTEARVSITEHDGICVPGSLYMFTYIDGRR